MAEREGDHLALKPGVAHKQAFIVGALHLLAREHCLFHAHGECHRQLRRGVRSTENHICESGPCVCSREEDSQRCVHVVDPWNHDGTRRHRQRDQRGRGAHTLGRFGDFNDELLLVDGQVFTVERLAGRRAATDEGDVRAGRLQELQRLGGVVAQVADHLAATRLALGKHAAQDADRVVGYDAAGPTDVVVGASCPVGQLRRYVLRRVAR
mmetsp:Transcript_48254/g.146762  ORF Transcript_48254/g.146762 Transcript_48254/m.146762 type:complete len:210 (+) Transcript_48254:481-1110(+)